MAPLGEGARRRRPSRTFRALLRHAYRDASVLYLISQALPGAREIVAGGYRARCCAAPAPAVTTRCRRADVSRSTPTARAGDGKPAISPPLTDGSLQRTPPKAARAYAEPSMRQPTGLRVTTARRTHGIPSRNRGFDRNPPTTGCKQGLEVLREYPTQAARRSRVALGQEVDVRLRKCVRLGVKSARQHRHRRPVAGRFRGGDAAADVAAGSAAPGDSTGPLMPHRKRRSGNHRWCRRLDVAARTRRCARRPRRHLRYGDAQRR